MRAGTRGCAEQSVKALALTGARKTRVLMARRSRGPLLPAGLRTRFQPDRPVRAARSFPCVASAAEAADRHAANDHLPSVGTSGATSQTGRAPRKCKRKPSEFVEMSPAWRSGIPQNREEKAPRGRRDRFMLPATGST